MKNKRSLFFSLYIFLSANIIISAQQKPLIRFGIMADIQYCNCENNGNRFYRNSLPKLDKAVSFFNSNQVDFTINLGDLVDKNFSDLDSVLIFLNKLDRKVINISGNHDYGGVSNNKTLYDKLSMPDEYFIYEIPEHNWLFIFLNTNELSSYANIKGTEKETEFNTLKEKLKKEGRKNSAPWNGGISKKQLSWLNNLLSEADKTDQRVLIFAHHPLYPDNGLTALNDKEILSVIEKYNCVKAVFAGHHHPGDFGYYKSIPFITLEGIVETEYDNSFGIVTVYNNRITIEGKGRMTSRELDTNKK
ncbi:3',5'-cyclic AMP phosphodiesterase CpdA [Dysgonomonas hofstadii]|uniref:3',5'-cyclic AMP phosphodiesterase CpdA n=1 Tax=Dysgonomonas hofstadii TaxID=637886 RepID=A0A840CW31_9BACT|nr:metallophosphoesterase [Dysgonomonas hofstadii]MBB4036682.1 3',5'-cyclic AMP phosphodiesterase CpdA [Dysgonomonas hofstadii]